MCLCCDYCYQIMYINVMIFATKVRVYSVWILVKFELMKATQPLVADGNVKAIRASLASSAALVDALAKGLSNKLAE